MIKQILDMLNADDWYGVSENIDIAKGKYRGVRNIKEAKNQIKRRYYGKGSIS
jgi:hypothetical protein